jgi:hypothetical protein
MHGSFPGKDDCGDRYDERGCPSSPNLKLRLVDGHSTSEGRVEIKAFDYPFGGICDDGFDLDAAHVVCRQLGFHLGAKEALIGSHFGSGAGPILLDELRCRGNETSLLECTFDPWAKHDCRDDEWAAVVCKNKEEACRQQEVPTYVYFESSPHVTCSITGMALRQRRVHSHRIHVRRARGLRRRLRRRQAPRGLGVQAGRGNPLGRRQRHHLGQSGGAL